MGFSIDGKTAIVTGSANGVGLAIGRHFLSEGANVVFADMDEVALEKELGKPEDEDRFRTYACDLRKKLSLANLLSMSIDAFERVDILVNASRQMFVSDPLDPKADAVEEALEQNLIPALRLTQMIAKRMIKQAEGGDEDTPAGSIINLSSVAAVRTMPDLMGYSVASAALDQMTRSMAVALAPHRIRVNAVSFGSVMSASLKAALKEHEDYRGDIIDHTPLGRIAGPGEVSDAVQYLASDASSFVTGQVITVDGGRTLLDAVGAPAH